MESAHEAETHGRVRVKCVVGETGRGGGGVRKCAGEEHRKQLVRSVKLGEFPQNYICIASMLFLLRFYGFCGGEGNKNSVGRLKATKAPLGSIHHAS